jgi:hypothetical protein
MVVKDLNRLVMYLQEENVKKPKAIRLKRTI